jgi:N-acetylmuramoyl-L-alanine amidase
VVVIDAGHGGSDPGKIGTVGTKEKDINLSIALRLQKLLTAQDIQVIMTRDEDIELAPEADNRKLSDMKERIALITREEADVVISIHQNSYTSPQVYGAQCFYYSSSPEGKTLAGMLQQQIVLTTGQTKVREIKGNSDYYLLKHSPSPCVIVECGFLSCPEEEQLLTTGDYQEKLAWAIHLAVLRYLNQT